MIGCKETDMNCERINKLGGMDLTLFIEMRKYLINLSQSIFCG